jgi:hypothetical protein
VKKAKTDDAARRAATTMMALDRAKANQAKTLRELISMRAKAASANVKLLRAQAEHSEAMFADIDTAIARMKTAAVLTPSTAEG